jgi:hypothetical protein
MDPQAITESHFIERYLLGDLSDAEARYLEQMLQQHPALIDRLDLPTAAERLTRLLALTGHAPKRPSGLPRWCHAATITAVIIAFMATIAIALGSSSSRRDLLTELNHTRAALADGSLTAPDHIAHVRITPSLPDQPLAVIHLGDRTVPALAEVRIDVSRFRAADFTLTIKRADHTYWGRIDRLHRDSNGDLSVGLNVATLPAGRYDWTIDELDGHGDRHPVGQFVTSVSAHGP